MCGIFVAIHKTSKGMDESLALYHRALGKMRFRGPDLEIESVYPHGLYLGQTVLSLTGDVSKSQGEHLCSLTGQFRIAFNGEIYNYQDLYKKYFAENSLLGGKNFSALTDTEVLVNLYEKFTPKEVSRMIDGMYAFVLYNEKKHEIFLSRDPQGEKSLFIYEDHEVIYIASEIQAILSVKPDLKLDPQVFKDYFNTRHFMFLERTTYQGIRQLRPGQTLALNLQDKKWRLDHELKISDWINPKKYEENEKKSLDDLVHELDELIANACREMIPMDRHFASVVSGGVDSSLLSHYALKYGTPKLLLAVNHEGKEQISHDLVGFEKVFKRQVSIVNVDRVVYAQSLKHCQKVLSAPIFSHSFVGQALQSQYARGYNCLAMFGGEGADELFGGYSAYLEPARRKLDGAFSLSPYSGYFPTFKEFNGHELLKNELSSLWTEAKNAYEFVQNKEERAAHAMMLADLSYQLPAVGLRGADLMSMMWSVETRSVFIRRKIVEFGLNLPMRFKSDINEKNALLASKKVLKNLFLKKFPENLLVKKQGFSGFPNESQDFLGQMKHFVALEFLGITNKDLEKLSFEGKWKLINIEHFLRGN